MPSDAPPTSAPAAGRRTAYVVLAGGSGSRVGAATNKVYLPLAGRPTLAWSLHHAAACPDVVALVLVVRPSDRALAADAVDACPGLRLPVTVTDGGATRHASEQRGLAAVAPLVEAGDVDLVAIHDGARPLADPALIAAVIEAASRSGAALPAVPAPDTVAVAALDGAPTDSPGDSPGDSPAALAEGADLVAVQTPQVFDAATLVDVFRRSAAEGFEGTDTASIWERYAAPAVAVVGSSRRNLKITYAADLDVAARALLTVAPAAGAGPG